MKNVAKISITAVLFVLFSFSSASAAPIDNGLWTTPEGAAWYHLYDRINEYYDNGLTLAEDIKKQPYMTLVAPDSDTWTWGTVEFNFVTTEGLVYFPARQTTNKILVYIEWNNIYEGYSVKGYEVSEKTDY